MTITEFLLARIAEDEQNANVIAKEYERWGREQATNGPDGSQGSILATALPDSPAEPARLLRECEAKRHIVAEHRVTMTARAKHEDRRYTSCLTCDPHPVMEAPNPGPCPTLLALASVYADSPDYDLAWADTR